MDNALIRVTQLPVIEEQLRALKANIDQKVNDALALACTPDTIQAVKSTRAELNKEFSSLEDQRKAVKKAVLGPYEQFEAVYKECVADGFKRADAALKDKISAVEGELKAACEEKLRAYFEELCQAEHIGFLKYEDAHITVDMASAKQKDPRKLKEALAIFVTGVAQDLHAIRKMDDALEILTEYRGCLDLARAVSIVDDRRRKEAEAQAELERRKAAEEAEAAAVEKVRATAPPEALLPPVQVPPPASAEEEKVYRCTFTVRGTKTQLRGLKEYMTKEGIQYE